MNSEKYALIFFAATFCTLNNACSPKKNTVQSAAKSANDDALSSKVAPTDEEKEKMARGLAYPYERSPHSFLLVGSEHYRITKFNADALGYS